MNARIIGLLVCLTLPSPALAEPGPARATLTPTPARDYVLVLIETGPLREPTEAQSKEAMAGHFANIERLAEAGELLIAGPFATPRADPDRRGLFVFDETTVEAGMALATTDPAVEMGVFVLTGFRFTTDAPLTTLPRLEKEDEARRLADAEIPDEWEGRRYVLATAPYSEELHKIARNTEGVLIAGRLHGVEGGDQVLVWVDAEDEAGAKKILPEGDWVLHGWYGSKTVAEMGRS